MPEEIPTQPAAVAAPKAKKIVNKTVINIKFARNVDTYEKKFNPQQSVIITQMLEVLKKHPDGLMPKDEIIAGMTQDALHSRQSVLTVFNFYQAFWKKLHEKKDKDGVVLATIMPLIEVVHSVENVPAKA